MQSLIARRRPAPLRLIYLGTALLIFLLLAIDVAVIVHLRQSELRDAEGQLKTLSLILAEQAERSFQSVDLVLSSVAEHVASEGVTDSASFNEKMAGHDLYLSLREKISGLPQLDAVNLFSRDGDMINSSRSWPHAEIHIADRDFFKAVKADPKLKSYVTEPVQNRATGTWTMYLAHRVTGADGEFLGVILGAIELRYFEDFYRAISHGNASSVQIQRLDGMMLARFPSTDTIGKVFSNSQHLLRDGVSGEIREASPIDGQMRIKAAHRLTNYPVLALATETEEAALADWRGIAGLMSLGAVGCAISIIIAAFALGRQWKQHAMLADAQAEIQLQEDLTAAFEDMRAAKEDAEMANRAKSEFLANMSHELRTPLNAVLGFSEVLVNEGFGPLGNERYRGYAQDIHASGTHLLGIINDILDLSKGASGKLELVEEWVDGREIVNAVCRLIRPRVERAKLSFSVKMPPGNLILYADERLLMQMLLNLLSNACKFTPADGHIECSVSVDDAGVTFAVTDTGIGIPAEDLERVLEPFAQIDSSLSRGQEGTGLGLALVKVMAELHGGRLHLASEIGRGTTASLILPLARLKSGGTDATSRDPPSAPMAEPVIA
jgi:signal transduction histidine kinase